jgi:di/tricarboxylate transporter
MACLCLGNTHACHDTPAGPAAGIKWGADMKKLGICVAIGTALWFAPSPAGVTTQAWHLLSIFIATIAGIITGPLPLGAVAMLGLGATMLTNTLTFQAAFSAFANGEPGERAKPTQAAEQLLLFRLFSLSSDKRVQE